MFLWFIYTLQWIFDVSWPKLLVSSRLQWWPGWLLNSAQVPQANTPPATKQSRFDAQAEQGVARGEFQCSFTRSQDLPILALSTAAFTHFPQLILGKMRESVCPSHLLTHHWSLSLRLYSPLWRKAWKSINKEGKDKWRSKASRAMKIRSSNDAYLPLLNLMALTHLKNQLTFEQIHIVVSFSYV